MFSSPRSVCRSIASLLAFGLMMQVSAIAAHAQQVTEETSDAKVQHSVSGEHQKEQIDEILSAFSRTPPDGQRCVIVLRRV